MRKKMYNLLLLLFLIVILGGCRGQTVYDGHIAFNDTEHSPQFKSVNNNYQQPLRVAVSTVLSPVDTIVHYRTIANYLGEKLGRPVILLQRKSYAEIAMLLVNGGADMAFLSTGAYVMYSNVEGTEALVSQQRMGVPYYRAYIVVPKDSPINSLTELRGKSMAFTDPISYSGHLYFESKLREMGETPEHFLGQFIYTYSHDKSLRAVSTKVVESACIDSLIYEYVRMKNPEITDGVKIINTSPLIGTGPVVIGRTIDAEQRAILKDAFLHMHENNSIQPALKALFIERFVPFQENLYEDISNTVQFKRREL